MNYRMAKRHNGKHGNTKMELRRFLGWSTAIQNEFQPNRATPILAPGTYGAFHVCHGSWLPKGPRNNRTPVLGSHRQTLLLPLLHYDYLWRYYFSDFSPRRLASTIVVFSTRVQIVHNSSST